MVLDCVLSGRAISDRARPAMALALGAKLSLVVVKQISKPIAAFVKREAKQHPMLSYPLEVAGGMTHRLQINLTRIVLGKGMLSRGSIATLAPLTKEHAVELGAELLGESVIFGIVGATVAFEVVRQVRFCVRLMRSSGVCARTSRREARPPNRLYVLRMCSLDIAEPRETSRRAKSRAKSYRQRAAAMGGARRALHHTLVVPALPP